MTEEDINLVVLMDRYELRLQEFVDPFRMEGRRTRRMEVKVAMQALLSRMQDYAVTMDHIAPSGGANSNQMTATISEPSVGASDRYNDDEGAAAGESSTQGAKKGKEWTLEMSSHTRHCSVCREAYKDRNVVTLPGCGHVYCQGCLDRVYDLSMSGETPFPPRCCKTDLFHLQEVRRFLSHNRASAFKRKELEWSSTDPTYCWQRTCSAFIPPTAIASTQGGGKIGKCPTCMEKTCAICKRAAHQGRECLEKAGNDESTRALLRLVDEEKWQRCYNCQRLVEKISDCEHIKCICGAEFCYSCGAPWEACQCLQGYDDEDDEDDEDDDEDDGEDDDDDDEDDEDDEGDDDDDDDDEILDSILLDEVELLILDQLESLPRNVEQVRHEQERQWLEHVIERLQRLAGTHKELEDYRALVDSLKELFWNR